MKSAWEKAVNAVRLQPGYGIRSEESGLTMNREDICMLEFY
jgi:hypothetical protein